MCKKLVFPNVPVLTNCQIKNSGPLVVDVAASSIARESGGGAGMSTKLHKKNTSFFALLRLFYALKSSE